MSVEVACWQCHGRLMIETPGVVVACPHCDAHLLWPPPSEDESPAPTPEADAHQPDDVPEAVASDAPVQGMASAVIKSSDAPPIINSSDSDPVTNQTEQSHPASTAQTVTEESVSKAQENPTSTNESVAPPNADNPAPTRAADEQTGFLSSLTVTEHSQQTIFGGAQHQPFTTDSGEKSASSVGGTSNGFPAFDSPSSSTPASTMSNPTGVANSSMSFAQSSYVATATSTSSATATDESPGGVSATSERQTGENGSDVSDAKPRMVPMLLFIIVLSYASAMTLAFVYLIYQSRYGSPHQLESLPDLKPPQKKGVVAAQLLVPVSAELPNGHTLQLGESRRFGNVRVTPMRVVKEQLQFEHYSGDRSKIKPATPPVLKLWLKFENVSTDQEFAPLDRELLLTRTPDSRNAGDMRSNQFVIRDHDKANERPRIQVYDLPPSDVWEFAGISSYPELGPGKSWETYIPTAPDEIDNLTGELIWRVQFRKGYNPQSFRGVTTLVEVRFHSSDIEDHST